MGDTANNSGNGGANGANNAEGAQNQGQNGGAGNDAGTGKPKRDPLYENLPDDHPLVKRHEALKQTVAELKPKAKLVDDAEEAKKTDAQKIADLTSQVEGVPAAVAAGIREHLVELHGIDQDDAELFLTGDTPELLLKQVARLLDQSGAGAKRKNNNVPKEGTKVGSSKPDATRDFIATITGREGQ